MKSKKAVIKLFETFAILVIFAFLLLLGLTFYSKYSKGKLDEKIREFGQIKAVKVALLVTSMPELSCGFVERIEVRHCIDLLKLNKTAQLIAANPAIYHELLKEATITIKQIYPEEASYTLYDWPAGREMPNFYEFQIPIALQNATSARQPITFGMLKIKVYY